MTFLVSDGEGLSRAFSCNSLVSDTLLFEDPTRLLWPSLRGALTNSSRLSLGRPSSFSRDAWYLAASFGFFGRQT